MRAVMRKVTALFCALGALMLCGGALGVVGGTADADHPYVVAAFAPHELCSGALVSPTVFVTAAHCTADLPSNRVWVSFDPRYTAGSSSLRAGTAHTDPLWGAVSNDSHDLAVVVLDASVAGVTPYVLPKANALDESGVPSQSFTNVGYGYTDRTFTFDGYRRWSASSFTNVKPTELRLSDKPGGVCFGDSGGPRLLGNVVVAVTSTGNKNCTGQSISYRLDTPGARAFLSAFVAAP